MMLPLGNQRHARGHSKRSAQGSHITALTREQSLTPRERAKIVCQEDTACTTGSSRSPEGTSSERGQGFVGFGGGLRSPTEPSKTSRKVSPAASTGRKGWDLIPSATLRLSAVTKGLLTPLRSAAGSWFSPLFIAVITLGLQWPQEAATFPAMPLSNLFANAVLRAQHLHLLAAETYKEFERTYIPEDQRHANKNSQAAFCYSETIPAPTGKDDAQQKSDIELLRFSLVLIQSWLTPVQYLSKVFTNNLVFGTSDRVYEKLKDLEEGIQALMRELEDRGPRGPQLLKPTYDKFDIHLRTEDALLKNYSLLSCFKKDLHKVETYLKVMKCRRYGEGNCTV
ncbi:LOW QUALITY PROTEIN: somatotropin [Falco peregrinus]|nr:LOW QUALITY PROTEIN: somatotropin [Falco peregrinus]